MRDDSEFRDDQYDKAVSKYENKLSDNIRRERRVLKSKSTRIHDDFTGIKNALNTDKIKRNIFK